MRAARGIGLVVLLAAALGCVHLLKGSPVVSAGGAPDGDTAFDDTSSDAIVVLGVSKIYAINVVSGTDDGVSWHQQRNGRAAHAKADGGFVVVKLTPQRGKNRYAIASVALEPSGDDKYHFPRSATVAVFDAPPGRVTYLGALSVQFASEGIDSWAQLNEDPSVGKQQAAAFIARRYPRIKGEVAEAKLEWFHKGSFDLVSN